jgi:hypothetical protein
MKAASWEIKENFPEYILIKDFGKHKDDLNITNNAGKVLLELWEKKHLTPKKKVFYLGSDKSVDELVWTPLAFGGIKFLGFQAGLEYLKLKNKK